MPQHNLLNVTFLYIAALACGYVMSLLHVPLPWMIGPLVLAAIVSLSGKRPAIPWITRPIGQLVVAASVGLFFTPAALTAVSEQITLMIVVAVLTIVAGFIAGLVLMRLAHIDVISASLASIPGGPVEMAALATRHSADPGIVAFAQILRIALLVMIIPPLLVALNGEVADPASALSDGPVDYPGALLLLAVALGGGIFLKLIRMTTPFFLGPLAASAVAAAMMLPISAPPYFVLAGAQVLLGVWLGCMFKRELFTRSPILIVAVLVSTAVLLFLTAVMALVISSMSDIEWQTMVLATAPGSVTEMSLTAKLLDQEVALVTAYHILRIFIILPLVPLIFARLAKRSGRSPASE